MTIVNKSRPAIKILTVDGQPSYVQTPFKYQLPTFNSSTRRWDPAITTNFISYVETCQEGLHLWLGHRRQNGRMQFIVDLVTIINDATQLYVAWAAQWGGKVCTTQVNYTAAKIAAQRIKLLRPVAVFTGRALWRYLTDGYAPFLIDPTRLLLPSDLDHNINIYPIDR
jgi:hypothetical protein